MTEAHERRVKFTRLIDAPVALVWAAWTDPKQVAQWWGPRRFTTPECKMDVRVGGRLYMVMKGPEGPGFPMDGVFIEVTPNEKLVFTNRPLGPDGEPIADGHTVVWVDAVDLLAWLAAYAGVKVETKAQTHDLGH